MSSRGLHGCCAERRASQGPVAGFFRFGAARSSLAFLRSHDGGRDSPSQSGRTSRALLGGCSLVCFGKFSEGYFGAWGFGADCFDYLHRCSGAASPRSGSLGIRCLDQRHRRGWCSRRRFGRVHHCRKPCWFNSAIGSRSERSCQRGRRSCIRAGSASGEAGCLRATGGRIHCSFSCRPDSAWSSRSFPSRHRARWHRAHRGRLEKVACHSWSTTCSACRPRARGARHPGRGYAPCRGPGRGAGRGGDGCRLGFLSGPDSSAVGCADAVASETGSTGPCGSDQCGAGLRKRRGQRRRQLRLSWLRREGGICQADGERHSSGSGHPKSGGRRAWCAGSCRPPWAHEGFPREEGAHCGSSYADAGGVLRCSSLGAQPHFFKRGARSVGQPIDALCRAVGAPGRAHPTFLVADGAERAQLGPSDAAKVFSEALRSPLPSELGVGQCGFPKGDGFHRDQARSGRRPPDGHSEGRRRSCSGRQASSKASSSAAGRKAERDPGMMCAAVAAPTAASMNPEPMIACTPGAKLVAGCSERQPNSLDTFADDRPFSVGACTASSKVAATVLGVTEPGPVASSQSAYASALKAPRPAPTPPKHVPQDVLLQCFPQGLPSDRVRYVPWVSHFLGLAGSARCSLGAFLRSSFSPHASHIEPPDDSRGDPWPVPPPPRWRRTADVRSYGPRRRHKCKLHALVRDLVRFLVGCLNWLSLGKPTVAPPCARARATGCVTHQCILEVIEHHASYFARGGDFTPDSLGRSEEKFRSLLSQALELPQDPALVGVERVDRLTQKLVLELQAGWDGYSRASDAGQSSESNLDLPLPAEPSGSLPAKRGNFDVCEREVAEVSQGIVCKPVVADRIKWSLPPSFDPVPFLSDPVSKALFFDPTCFDLPPERCPKTRPSKVHCTRQELLRLAAKWDAHQACTISNSYNANDEAVEPVETSRNFEFDETLLPFTRCFADLSDEIAASALPRDLGLHDDSLITPISPVWCDVCGRMLFGLMQDCVRCAECGRVACKTCAFTRSCAVKEIRQYLEAGAQLPFHLQDRCGEAVLVLPVVKRHPSVLRYVPQELWRDETFLRQFLDLGGHDAGLRQAAKQQLSELEKPDRDEIAGAVMAVLRQGFESSGVAFALELLAQLAEKSPAVLAAAKERLNDADAVVRAAAVSAVSLLARKDDRACKSVPRELFRRLEDESQAVRSAAIDALPQLHAEGRRKLSALTPRLQDSDPGVKAAALRCLQKLQVKVDNRFRKTLSKALADGHPDVREAAWSLIPHLDCGACAGVLADLSWAQGLDAATQSRLVLSLRSLLEPLAADRLRAIVAAAEISNWWLRLAMGDIMHTYVDSANPQVRLAAVDAVHQLADKMDGKAAAVLAARIEDEDAAVAAAAWKAVTARLEETSPDARRIAVESLAAHAAHHPKVLAAVLDKLGDGNWLVQTAACQALEKAMPGKQASLVACECLEHADENVRRAAAAAMAELEIDKSQWDQM
ncbi:unnamed protein product [Symbiodinium sp. CCMP2592]|nr:unnamed protein product [Symbiodinium sp. CCMP2592]